MANGTPWSANNSTNIQAGINQNSKTYENFSYFVGGIDVTQQNLDSFTPYIQGVSRIYIHQSPKFMNTMYPDETKQFKTYIESGYTRVSGISDIDVEFVDFEGGFAGQKFSNVSLARDTTESITISVYEMTGSPMRSYLQTWITGTRDTRSGIAHYHGAIAAGSAEYGEKNHTAEFVYAALDPTARAEKAEYVCLFAHCFPRRVPRDHLNYESGNRDRVQMELEFAATLYESPAINNIGKAYLTASQIDYNYLNFSPGAPNKSYNTYAYGSSANNSGFNSTIGFQVNTL